MSGTIGGAPSISGQVSTRNYVWNPNTLVWEAFTGSTGGSGVPATTVTNETTWGITVGFDHDWA